MLKRINAFVFFIMILNCCCPVLANPPSVPPTLVEAIKIQPGSHQDQISSTGTLISIPGIVVKSEISGRVTKIHFKSGDVVSAGAQLIEINTDLLKAQLADEQAQSNLTKLQFERFSELYKTHDVSKDAFDKAQASFASAQAKVENVQARLRQANIIAPFAGKLGLSQISVGDYITAGQTVLVNLQSLDPLRVDFSIPETYLSKVAVGQTVLLRTDAYPKEIFSGSVEAIESLINQNNRTLSVRASVPNKDGRLLPGAFVEATLQFDLQKQLTMIPQTAVVYTPAGNFVFKVVNGKAEKVSVTLGDRDSDNVVIKTGIKIGDVIITAGQLKTHEGSTVIVAENKKPAK